MTRYVDPRTGEPVTAYSELTQTEWAVFINDDWKVGRNLTINAGLRYENYGTFKDSDDTLRNIVFGPGSTFERAAGLGPRRFRGQVLSDRQQQHRPAARIRVGSDRDGKMAVRGGYGLAFDRLMNLPAENYRHSPPLRASVRARAVLRHAAVHLQPRRSVKPYHGYPVDPALQAGLIAEWRHRRPRALTTVDPDLKSPYAHNWFVGVQREIRHRRRRRRQLHRLGRPQPAQRLQHQPLHGRSDRRPVRRLQSKLLDDQHGDVDVSSDYHGAHDAAEAELPARASCCRARTRSAGR